MSRRDRRRLDDIQAAPDAIDDHPTQGLAYDAVRVRLVEIGEAVKGLSADLLATLAAAVEQLRSHGTD